jgi:hypothetical protein
MARSSRRRTPPRRTSTRVRPPGQRAASVDSGLACGRGLVVDEASSADAARWTRRTPRGSDPRQSEAGPSAPGRARAAARRGRGASGSAAAERRCAKRAPARRLRSYARADETFGRRAVDVEARVGGQDGLSSSCPGQLVEAIVEGARTPRRSRPRSRSRCVLREQERPGARVVALGAEGGDVVGVGGAYVAGEATNVARPSRTAAHADAPSQVHSQRQLAERDGPGQIRGCRCAGSVRTPRRRRKRTKSAPRSSSSAVEVRAPRTCRCRTRPRSRPRSPGRPPRAGTSAGARRRAPAAPVGERPTP